MSNVIKAMNVRYKDEKKELDFNEKAEGFVRLYAENLTRAEEVTTEYYDGPEMLDGDANESDELFTRTEEGYEGAEEPSAYEMTREHKPSGGHKNHEHEADPGQDTAQMLAETEEECRRMLEDTKAECNRIIEETRASLEAERDEMFDEAEKQGYSKGEERAKAEYDALKQELAEKLEKADRDFETKVDELEPAFAELTIKLIQKITGILVDDRRDLILHIIRQSILGMENSNSYIIHVSKDDFDFVNSKKQELLYELKGNIVEVVEDPVLTRAQCTIETDTRVFDCSLDVQLKNLIADIRLLAGTD